MRLSWNEIRTRACQIRPTNGRDAAYEKGETQSFYNDFFEIFGVRRRTVARYEEHVRRLDNTLRLHRPLLARRPAGRAEERRSQLGRRESAGRLVFRRAA